MSLPASIVAFDWRAIVAAAILLVTLAGVAAGRAPGLRVDRAGIALVGASLMILVGGLSFREALTAVDLDTIALLLGMMIIVAQLRLSGFFEAAGGFALRRARGPLTLLAAIVAVTGVLSAFLVNDAICLALTPLIVEITGKLRRNPVPYLLAAAMASNAGSVATFTGNPQNMIIGVASRISYAEFALRLAPVAAVALGLAFSLVALIYRAEFAEPFSNVPTPKVRRVHPSQIAKAALVTTGVVAAFFLGVPVAEAAMIGGSLLLVSRAVNPMKIYVGIDGRLLLMFAGLFIVVGGAEKALPTGALLADMARLRLDNAWILSGVTAALSNLVSNVPAVLVLKPFVAALPDAHRAWLVVAMSSTLAGNLTLVGSIANLIVVEGARRSGVAVGFLDHLKVGVPLTLLSLAFGAWRLSS